MTKIKWLTNSAFEFTTEDNKLITFDPCVRFMAFEEYDETVYRKPDYVMISHLHWDHIADIRYLYENYTPVILCGQLSRQPLAHYINANFADIYPAVINQELDFDSFKVKPLYAIHRNVKKRLSDYEPMTAETYTRIDNDIASVAEMGSLEMTNYLLTLKNGKTVLFWGGEFGLVQENLLRDLRPDVAIMQASPTMMDRFGKVVDAIKPKLVIPYHHDFGLTKDKWMPLLQDYQKVCSSEFVILDNGQEICL